MLIEESFVYVLAFFPEEPDGARRIVYCSCCSHNRCGEFCFNSDNRTTVFRFFKVNGLPVCEVCLRSWISVIEEALGDDA